MYKTLIILCLCMTINVFGAECPHVKTKLHIETYMGHDITGHSKEIVGIIANIYGSYPSFNQIDVAVYAECLKYFVQSKSVVICVAYDQETPVGIVSGIAMNEMPYFYKTPFYKNEHPFDAWYYIGEFGVAPEYKGRGLEKRLVKSIESFARANSFNGICKLELDANIDGSGYVPKTEFWEENKYVKDENMDLDMLWKNIGDEQETSHRAVYMFKTL